MFAEISTPALHVGWLVLKLDNKPRLWTPVIFAVTGVLFIGTRTFWTELVVVFVVRALYYFPSRFGLALAISGLVHAGLNLYWSALLVRQFWLPSRHRKVPTENSLGSLE